MSFVGTRPEAVKYVKEYKPEYMATLLLPAGITSEASIRYKDEAELLDGAEDVVNEKEESNNKYYIFTIASIGDDYFWFYSAQTLYWNIWIRG